MNFIFGSKGFAKEVEWLINGVYTSGIMNFYPNYYVVEDGNEDIGNYLHGREIISESCLIELYGEIGGNCFIGVGNPIIKQKISAKLAAFSKFIYPNLIHNSAVTETRKDRLCMGVGNIICANVVLTTNISLGDFVHINLASTVGHDCVIRNFTTISPGVNISGMVNIGKRVYIGTGSSILENVSIVDDCIIGAGSTVIKSIEEPGTYIGTPVRRIK